MGKRHFHKILLCQCCQVFRTAKLVAYIGGAVSLTIFVIIIPGVMATFHVLSETEFQVWVMALQVCRLLGSSCQILSEASRTFFTFIIEYMTLIRAYVKEKDRERMLCLFVGWWDFMIHSLTHPGMSVWTLPPEPSV